MIIDDYHKAIDFIESFSNISLRKNFGKVKKDPKFFLDRTKYFLDILGNPEKEFSYVHVTGTAGKGTVSSMIYEVMSASGKKTGLFTSPYVTTSIDKIKANGLYINPEQLIGFLECLKPFIEKAKQGPFGGPSAFEIFLAIALLHFQKEKCTWVVLEVGVGGRYDATNVITHPAITVITNISYDHTEILGKTLREIASDKAGIIKKGSKFFTSERRPQLQKYFKKVCEEMGAEFNALPPQKSSDDSNKELVRNIGKALSISPDDIETGIKNTRMSCRFEKIQDNPVVILDGAHNIIKIQSTINRLEEYKFKNLYVILALADTKKDHWAILKPLMNMPYKTTVIITQVQTFERRTISPKLLMKTLEKYKDDKNVSLEIKDKAQEALEYALKKAGKDDLVLATGSFFLSGELRKRWFSEEYILKHRTCV